MLSFYKIYLTDILSWRLATFACKTIIAATAFHFRVRNGNGCCHSAEPPRHNVRIVCKRKLRCVNVANIYCDVWVSGRDRRISTSWLNTLLCVHLKPINVIISHGSQMIINLGVGFPLRCFQRLSIPDIAALRCRWHDSR